jgi:Protein of unknown function (DUF4065)
MTVWSQNTEKLKQLILYIASRSTEAGQGDIFLNKVLYFSDAWAMQSLGEPITGARYQKLPMGPALRALIPVRREMIENGEVELQTVGVTHVTCAIKEPNLSLFTPDEIKLVDEVMGLFKSVPAKVISDVSHDLAPGWNLVGLKEDIPLQTQLISRRAPTAEVLERGRELASRFDW